MTNDKVKREDALAVAAESTRRNPDKSWDETPAELRVKPSGSEVVSFRLPTEELNRLEAAASALGETISQFIRAAITLRLEGGAQLSPFFDRIDPGAMSVVVLGSYRASSTLIDESYFQGVPDFAPLTVQGALRND